MVKGGVLLLGIGQLLGVEHQGSPETVQELLQNSIHMDVGSIYSERYGNIRAKMNQLQNRR